MHDYKISMMIVYVPIFVSIERFDCKENEYHLEFSDKKIFLMKI